MYYFQRCSQLLNPKRENKGHWNSSLMTFFPQIPSPLPCLSKWYRLVGQKLGNKKEKHVKKTVHITNNSIARNNYFCFLSCLRVFSSESALLTRWPKYWSFSFSISPSNEHPGLISFRMDRLDLLAVQGTLKSLLQHHSSKVSILRSLAFFTVQLSHPYMTTRKTIALTRRTFAGKVMSLLFNMLSRLS